MLLTVDGRGERIFEEWRWRAEDYGGYFAGIGHRKPDTAARLLSGEHLHVVKPGCGSDDAGRQLLSIGHSEPELLRSHNKAAVGLAVDFDLCTQRSGLRLHFSREEDRSVVRILPAMDPDGRDGGTRLLTPWSWVDAPPGQQA